MAVPVSQADIDALYEALRQGVLSVRHGDKAVTYQSREQMLATLEWMRRQIASPRRMGGVVGYHRDA